MKSRKLCPICKMEKEKKELEFCDNHNLAKEALKHGYEQWLKAYGAISWDDFLKELLDLHDLVGHYVKAVAEHERFFKI